MRAIALLIVAVVILALVGWITFNVSSDRAGVNIETEKVEQDTESLIEAGRELVNDAGEALEDATEEGPADSDGSVEVYETDQADLDDTRLDGTSTTVEERSDGLGRP
jgi:hypothetical protein